jgi:hypothetical protein
MIRLARRILSPAHPSHFPRICRYTLRAVVYIQPITGFGNNSRLRRIQQARRQRPHPHGNSVRDRSVLKGLRPPDRRHLDWQDEHQSKSAAGWIKLSAPEFSSERPQLRSLRKNSFRAGGRGFVPGIKPIESTWASAAEVRFYRVSPRIRPFPHPLYPLRHALLGFRRDVFPPPVQPREPAAFRPTRSQLPRFLKLFKACAV